MADMQPQQEAASQQDAPQQEATSLAPASDLPPLTPQDMPKSLRELLAQLDAEGITDYRRYLQVCRFLDFKAREKGCRSQVPSS